MKIKYSEDCVIGHENDGTPITLKEYQKELMTMCGEVIAILDKSGIPYFIEGGTLIGAVRHQDIIPWDDDIDLCFHIDDYQRLVSTMKAELSDIYCVQYLDTEPFYDISQPIIKIRKKDTYVLAYDKFYTRGNCKENGIFIDLIAISEVPMGKLVNFWYRKMAMLRTMVLLLCNMTNRKATWLKKRHVRLAYKFHKMGKGSGYYGYCLQFTAWQNIVWKKEWIFPLQKAKFNRFMVNVPNKKEEYLKKIYGDYMRIPNLEEVELLHSKDLRLKSGEAK